MLDEIKTAKDLIVGAKRTLKAVKEGKANRVYIAKDAEDRIIRPIMENCIQLSVEIKYVDTMNELGKACGIDVGAAVVTVVNE